MTTKINYDTPVTDTDFLVIRDSLHAAGKTLQMNIHKYLVAVAVQWHATGDIRPAVSRVNSLLDGMPKGVRSNAIRAWVELYFGFVIPVDGENKGVFIAGKLKGANLLMADIPNKRWFEVTPEQAYEPVNLIDMLSALIVKAQKAQTAGKGDVIDPALLNAVIAARETAKAKVEQEPAH